MSDSKAPGFDWVLFHAQKSGAIRRYDGFEYTGAILTSHLNPYQMKILIKLGCKVVFALDKGVDVREDDNIQRLKRYLDVEYIFDKDGLLEDKMSPVDAGEEVWKKLYERRFVLRG